MSVKKPKISVLIPVHNGADTLAETVASILNQTFADFELLLFDDASTDASPEIINSFADSRIRRFRSDANLGISEARNRLMELAEGEYLAVMDHDDLSAPRRLEKQAAWLDNNPEVAMVGSWGRLFCARPPFPGLFGRIKQAFVNLGWVWCQPEHPDIHDALCGNPVMHSSAMLRRSALVRDNIVYNPDYSPAEDYDLCRQLPAGSWLTFPKCSSATTITAATIRLPIRKPCAAPTAKSKTTFLNCSVGNAPSAPIFWSCCKSCA